ncbi:HEAT repeat domain-containing protein [Streptomyces sp. NPDC001393]
MAQEGILVSRRLVLKDSVSPDDVERLAETLNWRLESYVKRDADRDVDFSATWRADDVTQAHFTEDGYADERYFVVSGVEWSRIEEVLNGIQSEIEVWSLDELILEVDGNIYPASKGKAVLRLGLGAPLQAVDAVKDRILSASKNPEARVRRRAVRAIAYTPWPEYRERLAEMAEGDPDEMIAREAGVVVRALTESGGERS